MSDGDQKLEEEFMVQIPNDLFERLEEIAEEYGLTVDLIVNAMLKELLDTMTEEQLKEIAMEGEG